MKMVSLCHPVGIRTCGKFATRNAAKVLCSMETPPSQSTIKVLYSAVACVLGKPNFSVTVSFLLRAKPAACRCYYVQVVIIGATKEIGRTAIVAVSKARGMELAGAIDSQGIGEDAGQVLTVHSMCYFPCTALVSHVQSPSCCFSSLSRTLCECWHIALQISGMEEPLEIPVLNDLTMVLGSIAQVHTFCRCKFSGCFFRASSANCVVCSFSREQLAWLLISVNLQLFMTMSSRYVDVHLQQGK